ncbi:hypothetical protein [Mucilaginibacter aquaedulcis]|uniref:hypothetical protein n=1 Tax=Mucilaginibacter aquaedulcis TaxID=1187081 RepID=UPI0025B60F2E|nr:hypothetical protein [Mucilaginibacter aquaedulcis]MDN3550497.1 hypothetical protein [Mucilaginibacter aquaedulcis]
MIPIKSIDHYQKQVIQNDHGTATKNKLIFNFYLNNLQDEKKLMPIFGCTFLFFLMLSIDCKAQTIYHLYLTQAQMGRLLTKATDWVITFQYYHNSSNELTLYAWPKKINMNNNHFNDGEILKVNKAYKDLTGQKVLLASFHLSNDRFKTLLDSNRTGHYKFYQFHAKIKSVGLFGVGSYVYYEIWGADKDNKIISAAKITDTPNPSPPR